jgi:hypothetical protein
MKNTNFLLLFTLFNLFSFVACGGTAQNSPTTNVAADSTTTAMKVEPAADSTGNEEDTSFVNNGTKFIIVKTKVDDEDKYFPAFSYSVQKEKNNQRETVFQLETKWGLGVKDQDEDGNGDIVVNGNVNRYWSTPAFYLFNAAKNDFGKPDAPFFSSSVWTKISKGLFFDNTLNKNHSYSSSLFVVENGTSKVLGLINIVPKEEEGISTSEATPNKEPQLPKVTISKMKKGQNDGENEWEETINPDLLKKYFVNGELKQTELLSDLWQKNYQRML